MRRHFLQADTRALGLFRLVFGTVLLGYLVTRVTDDSLIAFQTNLGVYPNHYALFNREMPFAWSFLHAFSTPLQVGLAMAVIGAVYLCFTLGYRTRLFAALSLACTISLHHRMPLIVNGSMITMHLLLLWSLALPLGRHYSVDAWLRKRRGIMERPLPEERVTSLGVLGFRLNLFVVYLFNVLHKTGETWMEGEAVHYVLWQDRVAMWPAVLLREHAPAWFSPLATYGTLVVESLIAITLLSPLYPKHSRRIAAALMLMLHWGIGIMLDLGPFPVVFPSAALLMMASGDWSRFDQWVREKVVPHVQAGLAGVRERLKRFAAPCPDGGSTTNGARTPSVARRLGWRAGPAAREVYYALFLLVAALIIRHDNPYLKKNLGPFRLPQAAEFVGQTLYIPQGWALFAPEAPKLDGLLVIDMVLADGTRIDPLRHAPPDFEIMEHGPFGTDYFWQTYQPVLVQRKNPDLWRFFMDYVTRIPEIEEWEGERSVAYAAAYYVGGERVRPDGTPAPPPTIQLHAARGAPPPGHEVPEGVPLPKSAKKRPENQTPEAPEPDQTSESGEP